MSGEDRLCKRDAIVIYLVHWIGGGYCMTQFVFFYLKISFLYATLGTFFFLLGPCLRIKKPVLSITEV